MEETSGTATLVETPPFDVEAHGVTATLPRAEVERAARSEEGPVDLVLDVARAPDGAAKGGDVETARVRVAWTDQDLKRLLEAATGDKVTLTFSREELERALEEADVDAHGLREKIALLTVVAAAAAPGAAQAMIAEPTGGGGGGGGAVASEVSAGLTGGGGGAGVASEVSAGLPAAETGGATASEVSTGLEGATTPSEVSAGLEAPAADYGAPRTMPSDYAVNAAPTTPSEVSAGLTQPGAASEVSTGIEGTTAPSEVSTGIQQQAPEYGAPRAMPSDYGVTTPAPTPAGDEGISISAPDAGEAALAGGIILAITAAGFALRARRPREHPA